ncbi:MAG: type II secretion system protein [Phycisphaerales bacterium]
MAPIAKRSTRFGFTLLEVVLAIAVLVAVASLGSALWTQAGDASLGAQQRERGLKLQRIGTFLRDQWSQRRVLDPLVDDEDEAGLPRIVFSETGVTFPTAKAMLFGDAPLVEARYEVRRRSGGRADLWYIESPITRFGSDAAVESRHGFEAERREVLLLAAGSFEVERYGPPVADDEDAERDETEGGAGPRPGWFAFTDAEAERNDGVRLTVRYSGEEAVWVLVARPSR